MRLQNGRICENSLIMRIADICGGFIVTYANVSLYFSEVSHRFFSHIGGKQPIFFSFCIYSENMRFYLDLPPFISSKRIYATVQIFRGNSIGGRPIESNVLYCLPALLNILLMMLLVVTNKISRARPLQICNNLYYPPISSLPSQKESPYHEIVTPAGVAPHHHFIWT